MKKIKKFRAIKKAQTAEILNFLVLVVVVTIIIIVLKAVVIDQKVATGGTAQGAQEESSFRSGVNAFMVMTEERSGKTFLELLGYVGFTENTSVDLGGPKNPLVINVTEEVTMRLDAIYGEGHWNLVLPIPYRSGIQMFIVIDTSLSMCDDVQNLKEEIPQLMNELKKAEKETKMYIYFLAQESAECYWKENKDDPNTMIQYAEVDCADFKEADPDISCRSIIDRGDIYNCNLEMVSGAPATEEDWGNAIACISEQGVTKEIGDEPGWDDFSIKIGIPLSDELTVGSECGDCTESDCTSQKESLWNGIDKAKENDVTIFPLKADSCGTVCGLTKNRVTRIENCDSLDEVRIGIGTTVTYCHCGNTLLTEFMEDMANETGGKVFDLKLGSPAEAIKEIALNQSFDRKPIELGSPIPGGKRIRSFIVAAPMPNYEYLNLTLKQWN